MELSYSWSCIGIILISLATSAWSAGPTGEEEALGALNSGRHPVALSRDNRWILHTDARNVLSRSQVESGSTLETVDLPRPVQALSASRTGKKAAFILDNSCVGVASFTRDVSGPKSPKAQRETDIVWFESDQTAQNQWACPGEKLDEVAHGPDRAFAVAISSDGKFLAIAGNPIRIIDVVSRKVHYEIPTGPVAVLGLKFVDSDLKLLVVQALMGEGYESSSTGSDMQFAIWDLKKGSLLNFYNTKTAGDLLRYDFFWDFSEATGTLWAVNTNGIYWEEAIPGQTGSQRLASIHLFAPNLKACSGGQKPRLVLPPVEGDDGWLSFAADPLGRYIAGVTPTYVEDVGRATSTLWIKDSNRGNSLSEWKLDYELRALVISQDGKTIFGTAAGQPGSDQLSYTRYGWSFHGGGTLMRFEVPVPITRLQIENTTLWSEQSCLIEDEEPYAREISEEPRNSQILFDIRIAKNIASDKCDDDRLDRSFTGGPHAWRLLNDGTLYIDQWDHLERIDIDTGEVIQSIPTPRNRDVCSRPIYDHRLFINWQGDTITLRPFERSVNTSSRKVLARKPGWSALNVEPLRDHFGIRWIQLAHANDNMRGQITGSALATVYDLSGKMLAETSGAAVYGQAIFEIENDEVGEGQSVFSEYKSDPYTNDRYQWENSYGGSLRVFQKDPSTDHHKTVMWSGLRIGSEHAANDDSDDSVGPGAGRILPLDSSFGAIIEPSKVRIYDAASRRLLTTIKVHNAINVAWDPARNLILVESYNQSENSNLWKLSGYRIDQSEAHNRRGSSE